jgi:hypothetical protein
MGVNNDKPQNWKGDIALSVDMYNDWFLKFAPKAFRDTRLSTTEYVENALKITDNLKNINAEVLYKHPEILSTLRMATCPPIAVDRLIGLAKVPSSLVLRMEKDKKLPKILKGPALIKELDKIGEIIEKLADPDIFTWLPTKQNPSEQELHRAATIVADRLCGSVANPIIRNAQEKRQLAEIKNWLEKKGYQLCETPKTKFSDIKPGQFAFRLNVPVKINSITQINIPIDAVIKPVNSKGQNLPLLFEAKSAGDFTNVNKRRKEEATKMSQLRQTYGQKVSFNLFLCGYFDSGYLGYEAAEGIDWVWEHRIEDLEKFGI